MLKVVKNILNRFMDPIGGDLLLLPENIKNDLLISLSGDEKIVISMKTDRAIYRAGLSKDSNTFYKAYAICTGKRLILAKDSSRLNIFREFQISQVNSILYQESSRKPEILIDMDNSKYVLSFPPGSFAEAKTFFDKFNSSLNNEGSEKKFCRKCGNKIDANSVYCSYCGEKIS